MKPTVLDKLEAHCLDIKLEVHCVDKRAYLCRLQRLDRGRLDPFSSCFKKSQALSAVAYENIRTDVTDGTRGGCVVECKIELTFVKLGTLITVCAEPVGYYYKQKIRPFERLGSLANYILEGECMAFLGSGSEPTAAE